MDVTITIPQLDGILQQLTVLERLARQQLIQERRMSKEMDDLTAQVEQNRTVTQSAITLIQGIKARLDAAGTDPAKLQALRDDLASQDQALADAVTTNTPAEPSA